jgi:hypothetical protein
VVVVLKIYQVFVTILCVVRLIRQVYRKDVKAVLSMGPSVQNPDLAF